MFKWLREYYELKKELRVCESCETLRRQLEIVNLEKERLLNRLLQGPNLEPRIKEDGIEAKVILPKVVPWNVRRQMMEHEDREKAKLMKLAPKSTEELEAEILTDAKQGS